MHNLHRFHVQSVAMRVHQQAQSLTNAKLSVEFLPFEGDDKPNAPGRWAIVTHDGYSSLSQLNSCINYAIQLTLARELEQYCPSSPLLSIWHLKPGNICRFDI